MDSSSKHDPLTRNVSIMFQSERERLLLDWMLAIHHFDVVHESNNADWSDTVNESRCCDGIRTQSREFLDFFLA